MQALEQGSNCESDFWPAVFFGLPALCGFCAFAFSNFLAGLNQTDKWKKGPPQGLSSCVKTGGSLSLT